MSQVGENSAGYDESEYEAGADQQEEQQLQAAEAAIAGLNQQEEEQSSDDLQDVDLRLETADYYRAVLRHSFFDVEGPAARTVDREIRVFIRGRLEVLLGLKSQSVQQEAPQLPFTPEQIEALKALSNKVLGKPQLLAAPAPKKPQPVQVVQMQRAKPTINKVVAPGPAPSSRPAAPSKAPPVAQKQEQKPVAKKGPKVITPKNANKQTIIEHDGTETTLIEGQVTEEGGKKFRVERNDKGTLYRKDITEQQRPVHALPPMSYDQMNAISEQWASKNVASAGEITGMAVVASLSKG